MLSQIFNLIGPGQINISQSSQCLSWALKEVIGSIQLAVYSKQERLLLLGVIGLSRQEILC